MGRAPCCDKAIVKRGPWSPEEDAKLKDYIHNHGTAGNWIALPHKAGLKRCGKSCRLRWLNYLRPNIKHGDFSDDEDRIICSLFATIGSRWSIMAAQLPGRTDNDIKNYWNTKLKKKLMGLPPTQRSKPNYHMQMQPSREHHGHSKHHFFFPHVRTVSPDDDHQAAGSSCLPMISAQPQQYQLLDQGVSPCIVNDEPRTLGMPGRDTLMSLCNSNGNGNYSYFDLCNAVNGNAIADEFVFCGRDREDTEQRLRLSRQQQGFTATCSSLESHYNAAAALNPTMIQREEPATAIAITRSGGTGTSLRLLNAYAMQGRFNSSVN